MIGSGSGGGGERWTHGEEDAVRGVVGAVCSGLKIIYLRRRRMTIYI